MSWSELLGEVCKKILIAIVKAFLFCVLLIFSAIEILVREVNTKIRKYLFPNRK
jgi:hypothetical protein